MNIFKAIITLGLVTQISGCYINIISPPGGTVKWGVEECDSGTVCKYTGNTSGGFFPSWEELFIATPAEGYSLAGWDFSMRADFNPLNPGRHPCDAPEADDAIGSCRLNFSRWNKLPDGSPDQVGITAWFENSNSQGYLMPVYVIDPS